MKLIIPFLIALLTYFNIYAQDSYNKFGFGVDGGYSMPIGTYAKADNANSAGFAKNGWKVGLNLSYNILKNVSIISRNGYVYNSLNSDEFSKIFSSNLKTQISNNGTNLNDINIISNTDPSSWSFNFYQMGATYKLFYKKFEVGFFGTGGYANIRNPNLFSLAKVTNFKNGNISDVYLKAQSSFSGGVCYSIGTNISYPISKILALNIGMEYFGIKTDIKSSNTTAFYNYANPNNGNIGEYLEKISANSVRQNLSAFNITMGIVLNFGNRNSNQITAEIQKEKGLINENTKKFDEQTKLSENIDNKEVKDKMQEVQSTITDAKVAKDKENNTKVEINNKTINAELNMYFINTNIINLRSGPGKNYEIVTKITLNEIVEVIEKTNSEWWRIIYKDKTGYVSSAFLTKK